MNDVQASQQLRADEKRRERVKVKEACVGTTALATGYKAEYTISVTGWFKASDEEMLQMAWETVAKEGDVMPSVSQFHSYTNDGFTVDNAVAAVGQISLRNITQGFDITEENPVTFSMMLGIDIGKYRFNVPKMYVNYSNDPETLDFTRYPTVSPMMKSNVWGPVAFMIVCPNVITPNDPDGAVLDDFEILVNKYNYSDDVGHISITPSW